jgi:hypothetical protein
LQLLDNRPDVRTPLLVGERHHNRTFGCNAGWRVKSQQCPPGGNAFVDLLQEPRVADLVLHQPLGILFGAAAFDPRLLGRFLRAIPGRPRFPFQSIDLLQLNRLKHVEVANARLAPIGIDTLQIPTDRCLGNLQLLCDRSLGPAL